MIVPSYFSDLATNANMQLLIDSSQLMLEEQSIWRRYLNVALPQMSLSFDSAIGRERIAAAASIVEINSPAPLRTRNKLELYKGKIPAIKEKFEMNQDDMRTLEILKMLPTANAGDPQAIIKFLNKDLQEASVSGDKRIDIMLLQALSTLKIDVNATNNPDGVIYGELDLLAKPYQTQGVPVVWSNAANSKPVTDIERFVENIWKKYGRQFGKILMSYDRWLVFKQSAEVRSLLQTFFNVGKANATFAVTLSNVNEFFASNKWPEIEVINHLAMIEVDGAPTYYSPFKAENVSFVPNGKLGTLFNGVVMEDLHRVTNKSYAKFGPTLVSKWCESDPLTEYTAMEMLAFPSIDVDNIFILTTETVGDLGIPA